MIFASQNRTSRSTDPNSPLNLHCFSLFFDDIDGVIHFLLPWPTPTSFLPMSVMSNSVCLHTPRQPGATTTPDYGRPEYHLARFQKAKITHKGGLGLPPGRGSPPANAAHPSFHCILEIGSFSPTTLAPSSVRPSDRPLAPHFTPAPCASGVNGSPWT